jgi:hypothetical protein
VTRSDNERALIENSRRYVAFLDVLGYGSLVRENATTDIQKLRRLSSMFEALGNAVDVAMDDNGDEVESISFSDSYYFACKNLVTLLEFLQQVFADAYTYQMSYCGDPDGWIPFFRAGVVSGWAVSFRDITLRKLEERSAFRNPVGPAVADAYELTEKRGGLSGWRCFLEESLLEGLSPTWVRAPPHGVIESNGSKLLLLRVPATHAKKPGAPLVEIAWPLRVIQSDNCTFLSPLLTCRHQFPETDVNTHYKATVRRFLGSKGDVGSIKHYTATVDLFRKCVEISGDSNARQVLAASSLCP